MIEAITPTALEIPFKTAFAHASAERRCMQSIWVEVRLKSGARGYGEGCPREYVTGETIAGALAFVDSQRATLIQQVHDLDSLKGHVLRHQQEIDANPAAWCAVELALLDAHARSGNRSVEALLDSAELSDKFRYSAVIGDGAPQRFEAELSRYLRAGFRTFKIKLSGARERDLDKVRALKAAAIPPSAVRADANNLWRDIDVAREFLAGLDYDFWALEEPLRAGDLQGMTKIASETNAAIILDESLLRSDQLTRFAQTPQRWIVNLRVSKMGGVLRSLDLLENARKLGLGVIVGAHVGETSVLTRAGLTVATAAGDSLIAQEGAFGTHLLEHDVIEPPLMFGAGGMLDSSSVRKGAGFGFAAEAIRSRNPL